MRAHEPLQYLPHALPPIPSTQMRECAMHHCHNVFQVTNGVAFECPRQSDGELRMFYFCCEACYLSGIEPSGKA